MTTRTGAMKEWSTFYLKDVTFKNLMTMRICDVLIVANPYDAFILNDDGRVEERVFNEYAMLGMFYPPTFTQVSTLEEAYMKLRQYHYDLIICMPGNADNDAFEIARGVKKDYPHLPCVVLTPYSHGITRRMENEDLSLFDYVFCWMGDVNLILSIIKLIEDKMNMRNDILEGGVQMILLVEDSIRFSSSLLPALYSFILKQSNNFVKEALNPHNEMLRMRGRPKVAFARNYEEAIELYHQYQNHILGVISDCSFNRDGKHNHDAGFDLLTEIRANDEYIPLILQSSESSNSVRAKKSGFHFVDKNSKTMSLDLRQVMEEHFGFGDFIFRDPKTHEEVARVRTLKELQDSVFDIPYDSMLYHVSRNHVSRWLSARAIFPVSEFLKNVTWHKLPDVDEHRRIIFDAIVEYRRIKNRGVVAVFDRAKFDKYAHFARIGEGSLGGKGRGLAFLDNILNTHENISPTDKVEVTIPKTVVLCTDIFDRFMEDNNLYEIALSQADDETILKAFLKAQLPDFFIEDFLTFFDAIDTPIAIRSSSLLEDSHYQPFAGVYSTYMIPNMQDRQQTLRMLAAAIKGVYASVFYTASKAYMTATGNLIDEEKMAVVMQEVVGRQHGDYYYPNVSGVLRSLNYYPINDEKAEEGVVELAFGLGKYIVEGGVALRVSPYHPKSVLQLSDVETTLKQTQTIYYALDTHTLDEDFKTDDGFNIRRMKVKQAEIDGALKTVASTYDPYDNVIRDGIYEGGRKVISFAGLLKYELFPLPELLRNTMRMATDAMKHNVEIEFVCNVNDDYSGDFYLLQIRPTADNSAIVTQDIDSLDEKSCLVRTASSLGNGTIEGITDVIYVKTDPTFNAANNPRIAMEIEQLNRKMTADNIPYILCGPGRWGSSDAWLGIPVKWPHISSARVIIELRLPNYPVDPSQGTHFFHNLTSFGVGYLTIDTASTHGAETQKTSPIYRKDILDAMPAVYETEFIRHVRFDEPLTVYMDGKTQKAAVLRKLRIKN
ncbi:MAG: phosphoenolpyruvate synthase [Prevotella sp.]|nr:phosphoenolpyruvate synthase [Prevotella sp.]